MNRLLTRSIVIGAYLAGAFAISSAAIAWFAQRTQPGHHLKVPTQAIDMGVVEPGPPVTRKFEISNAGTEPVIINSIAGDCGCTKVAADAMTLKPGEHSDIELTFNPTNYAGEVTRWITILSNDDAEPERRVPIQFDVRFRARLEQALVDLKPTQFPKDVTSQLALFRDPHYVSATDVSFDGVPPWLELKAGAWQTQGRVLASTLNLTASGELPTGHYHATVVVHLGKEVLHLQVNHVVQPLVRAEPAAVLIRQDLRRGSAILNGPPVHFLQLTTRDRKAVLTVEPIADGGYTLLAREVATEMSANGDYDVAELTYISESLHRKETIEVPLRFSPN